MRSFILSVAALFLSVAAFAQYATPPDYFREISLNVGVAPYTHPGIANYVGDKNKLPFIVNANMYYNFTQNFQLGADLSMTQWQASGEHAYNGTFGSTADSRKTTYLYADKAYSLVARANYVIPKYDDWHVNRSNLYFGVAVGAAFTVNDGNEEYSQADQKTGEENRYLTQFNYQAGSGLVLGAQIGYSYYFGNHTAFNIEAAPRYTRVYTIDARYDRANHEFDVWSYPITVGLKFRF